MTYVHVYAPTVVKKWVRSGVCLDCGQRTRFLGLSYEYHGPDVTCIKCGRSWSEGEWMPLPFMRGAREKSIASAKAAFRAAKPIGVEEMLRRAAG